MDSKQPSKRVEFLYLQQEDCVKAGGLDMKGTMRSVERSFFLYGHIALSQPGKPVIRWGLKHGRPNG
jgi:N-[(2S)-2-amino-2-carboxyethyl]-L-glutamate dehydrogenase